ncbi:hypothetical protein [Kocuria rosea]|uniref:Uncharacterized protein n=1 Tax=Kocuria rosea TaxID=1275 RepID=A0A4V3B1X2_KOCRO|nr:hypothetical protein [Kocuria rosea]TDL38568.1 hypothetical protein E2R59_16810 [Kocuria rosea]
MNESAQQTAEVPVPTGGQVLARAVPAAAVLTAGFPALVQWGLDDSGTARSPWVTFGPALLLGLALIVQRLVQAPRARLGVHQDKRPLRRSIGITASSGRVPDDPGTRIAAGVLACTQLESATTIVAGIAGVVAIWILRTETWWAVTAILMMLVAVVPVIRARRGWAYLRVLHADDCDGPATSRPTSR